MKIRALIIDDERPARARLRQLLRDEADVQVVGECANGRQAIAAIRKERPEVVFLDVQMPRLSGFDVCAALTADELPLVIFATAYDQYALKAFDVHAIDYLLKPIDLERLQRALGHVRGQLSRAGESGSKGRLEALLEDLYSRERRADRLAFRIDGRVVLLRPEEIHRIEADGNYVRVHTNGGVHHVRETMQWFEQQMPAKQFLRINRSMILNLDRIKELQPLFYGDYAVVLLDGTRLTLSRNYRDRLEKLLVR